MHSTRLLRDHHLPPGLGLGRQKHNLLAKPHPSRSKKKSSRFPWVRNLATRQNPTHPSRLLSCILAPVPREIFIHNVHQTFFAIQRAVTPPSANDHPINEKLCLHTSQQKPRPRPVSSRVSDSEKTKHSRKPIETTIPQNETFISNARDVTRKEGNLGIVPMTRNGETWTEQTPESKKKPESEGKLLTCAV